MTPFLLFDFIPAAPIARWEVIDDVVMGGKSTGEFDLNKEGHGIFKGAISLENNGGFSSVKYQFESKEVSSFSEFVLRLKGDGKNYRFRVKSNSSDQHSYSYAFTTTEFWQTIRIPFHQMIPFYRGQQLNQSNYPGEKMEEIAFLIGNKKAEEFQLKIDKIEIH